MITGGGGFALRSGFFRNVIDVAPVICEMLWVGIVTGNHPEFTGEPEKLVVIVDTQHSLIKLHMVVRA